MNCIEKFTFSRRFSDLPAEESEESAPARHDDEDLARARAEGEAAGLVAGLAEGRAQAEADFQAALSRREVSALEAVAGRLAECLAERRAIAQAADRAALLLAAAALRKALPGLHRAHAFEEIEAMVLDVTQRMVRPQALRISVHPDLAPAIGERLAAVTAAHGAGAALAVVGAPELAPGDCRIDWEAGGAERRLQALMKHIDDIVATMADSAAASAEAAPSRGVE